MKGYEFTVFVLLEDDDDEDAVLDAVTDAVCRHFGAEKCGEGIDCPRQWVASYDLVPDEEDEE